VVDDVNDGGDEILDVLGSIRESLDISCGVSDLPSMASPKNTASFEVKDLRSSQSRNLCK
jgi:hypothetical protein